MKEKITIRYISEYRGVGVIASDKEHMVIIDNPSEIRWVKSFKRLLYEGFWCQPIATMLGIGLMAPCKARNSATLDIYYQRGNQEDVYTFHHDENKVLCYTNEKLIRELKHGLRAV